MASLQFVYSYRYAVFTWAVFECLVFSAIVYGWASLVYILKEETFFHELCPNAETFNATNEKQDCVVQDDLLNLAFTVGVFTFTAFGLVAGALLDHGGPRLTRLVSCISFALTGLIFAFTDKDRPMLLFPGVIGLTISGILLFVTMLQLSVLFRRWSSLASSFLNGALDSSSIMLLFFKLIYSKGIPLKWIFGGFFTLAVMSTGLFTFVLPPDPIEREHVEELANKESPMQATSEVESDFDSLDSLQELFKETNPEKERIGYRGSLKEFWNIATSPIYLLHVAFLSTHKLRLWFYMGSMHTFLQFASGNDLDSVNTYLNTFGLIQFTGMLFSPIAGYVMDWRPQSKDNETFGFVVAFCLTNALDILLNILVIIPVLELQVLSFVTQVALRAFLYSTYAGFILHRFPLEHCGKLYGLGHFIGAIIGALQFYLFVVVHSHLNGNPFWVNVGFLIATLAIFVHPFYIWVVTERETEAKKPNRTKYAPLKEEMLE